MASSDPIRRQGELPNGRPSSGTDGLDGTAAEIDDVADELAGVVRPQLVLRLHEAAAAVRADGKRR